MQLVAYGAQDVYLTGNPVITFFKAVYRRHTNFAMESIEQTMNGTVGSRQTATISRNGDLITDCYLQFTVKAGTNGISRDEVFDAINSIDLVIGGQRIDRHYGQWMKVWTELSSNSDKKALLDAMMMGDEGQTVYVPLQFFFCRNPGLALPLIALQYHEVKMTFEWNNFSSNFENVDLYVDYVYLDTDERRRFAQVAHEMLIEQLQADRDVTPSSKIALNFNHPVKEIVWVANADNARAALTGDMGLSLNGHERFKPRSAKYFSLVQPYKHHSGDVSTKNVNVYSFALRPEEHQPSGTCNFSRIDNAHLTMSAPPTDKTLNIYATNYNILRIMSGMGGLAFSN